jgi:ABC-type glycerol-3-phosphate transport system permease component
MTSVGTSLEGARPELLIALATLRAVVTQEHPQLIFEIADFGGLRSEADTAKILGYRETDWAAAVRADPSLAQRVSKEDWRPIAPYGSSMHNYGAAFDVRVTATPPGMSNLAALNILKDYADVVGLVDGRDFGDPPHFELPGGIAAARAAWQKTHGVTVLGQSVSSSAVTVALIIVFGLLAAYLLTRGSAHVRS